ncbi:hypothetical protein Q8A73_014821 [Channa argus]|nr:hypothetical protein Q8A73_014821 [Channa argus]
MSENLFNSAPLAAEERCLPDASPNLPAIWTGGTVRMVCRNRDRTEEARVDIANVSGNTVSVSLEQESPAPILESSSSPASESPPQTPIFICVHIYASVSPDEWGERFRCVE